MEGRQLHIYRGQTLRRRIPFCFGACTKVWCPSIAAVVVCKSSPVWVTLFRCTINIADWIGRAEHQWYLGALLRQQRAVFESHYCLSASISDACIYGRVSDRGAAMALGHQSTFPHKQFEQVNGLTAQEHGAHHNNFVVLERLWPMAWARGEVCWSLLLAWVSGSKCDWTDAAVFVWRLCALDPELRIPSSHLSPTHSYRQVSKVSACAKVHTLGLHMPGKTERGIRSRGLALAILVSGQELSQKLHHVTVILQLEP